MVLQYSPRTTLNKKGNLGYWTIALNINMNYWNAAFKINTKYWTMALKNNMKYWKMAHWKFIWKILDWKTKMNENLQHVQWVLSSPDMKGVWSFKRLGSVGRCLLSFYIFEYLFQYILYVWISFKRLLFLALLADVCYLFEHIFEYLL